MQTVTDNTVQFQIVSLGSVLILSILRDVSLQKKLTCSVCTKLDYSLYCNGK